jgi:ElaB/YqjD/DUF883 family membrane-anchored ribosome-binding protein
MGATSGFPGREDIEPESLQRDADALRANMNRTLNALERKLSPRQLLDRSLHFMQENGGDVLQKIGATVNKNPLPLILTSAGLIWLVAASRRSPSSERWRRFESSSLSMRGGDFDPTSQSFEGSAQDTARGLKARAHRTLDATRERASRTWGATRERTQELGGNLNGLIREQPLVCGAIALAIGAIIGAALPASAYERNLIDRARKTGGEVLDDVAGRAQSEAVNTTADRPPISH